MNKVIVSIAILCFAHQAAFAQIDSPAGPTSDRLTTPVSVFRNILNIPRPNIVVPTVVEVSFKDVTVYETGFLVQENETGLFLPSYFKDIPVQINETLVAQSVAGEKSQFMVDGNPATAVSFPILHNGPEETDIRIDSKKTITTSQLQLTLPANVTLPSSIAITARDADGVYQTVVAKKQLVSTVINFPETISDSWRVTLEYVQPLRIAELSFTQDRAAIQENQSLRFLAQPGKTYTVYFNPDQSFEASTGESGNLQTNSGVRLVQHGNATENPRYIEADIDGDGVTDVIDNCPSIHNSDQFDIDENSVGDMCDDYDRDSVLNIDDNCQDAPNINQADVDGDGIGDSCDEEESRFTERYTWVPWAGMGIACLVIIGLFGVVLTSSKKPEQAQ